MVHKGLCLTKDIKKKKMKEGELHLKSQRSSLRLGGLSRNPLGPLYAASPPPNTACAPPLPSLVLRGLLQLVAASCLAGRDLSGHLSLEGILMATLITLSLPNLIFLEMKILSSLTFIKIVDAYKIYGAYVHCEA